jgi:hypothetical protein
MCTRFSICLESSWSIGSVQGWRGLLGAGFPQGIHDAGHSAFDTAWGCTETPSKTSMMQPDHAQEHVYSPPLLTHRRSAALGAFFRVAPCLDFSLCTRQGGPPSVRGRPQSQELWGIYYDRWVRAHSLALELCESLEPRFSEYHSNLHDISRLFLMR